MHAPDERQVDPRRVVAALRERLGARVVAKRVAVGLYDDGFIHAGNLAYLSLLAIFPFLILAAAVARVFGLTEDTGWFRMSVGAVSLPEIAAMLARLRAALEALTA